MNSRVCGLLPVLMLAACSSAEGHPPGLSTDIGQDASRPSDDSGFIPVPDTSGPPPVDASGYCGNEFFRAVPDPPNLYFVLDRSGSMGDVAPGTASSKYTVVRIASVALVRSMGTRALVGAALFPGNPDVDECGAGREVFATRLGDAPTGGTEDGPVTRGFASALDVRPIGGTPTASTLVALKPILTALQGKTSVILATDGGPNCNATRPCAAADCIWNIEGQSVQGTRCSSTFNCCDPSLEHGPGINGCLDAVSSIDAVQQLWQAGIRTYVIGIPGSGPYASVLDQLAVVGGTARAEGETRYYRVDDMSGLGAVLMQVATQALISCEFTLEQTPPEPGEVNVYLDQDLVPYDVQNGWSWLGAQQLALHGQACQKLERGQVQQVQVVAGCPTQQPR